MKITGSYCFGPDPTDKTEKNQYGVTHAKIQHYQTEARLLFGDPSPKKLGVIAALQSGFPYRL